MYTYKATVINVVDGDTFDLDIDLGFHIHIHERVRLLDVDTPEKRGAAEKHYGQIVTDYATSQFLNKSVNICSKKEIVPKTDSFGRWLVDIFIDGQSIANIYSDLGVNKLKSNYSESNVLKLESL